MYAVAEVKAQLFERATPVGEERDSELTTFSAFRQALQA